MTDFGARRVGESEHEFCERRGREAAERAAVHDAAIEAAKAGRRERGEPEPDNGALYFGVGGHMSASEYAAGGYQISGRGRR